MQQQHSSTTSKTEKQQKGSKESIAIVSFCNLGNRRKLGKEARVQMMISFIRTRMDRVVHLSTRPLGFKPMVRMTTVVCGHFTVSPLLILTAKMLAFVHRIASKKWCDGSGPAGRCRDCCVVATLEEALALAKPADKVSRLYSA